MRKLVNAMVGGAPKSVVIPPPSAHLSGMKIINFTLGDPGKVDPKAFATPQHIREAAADGLMEFHGEYLPPRGHPELVALLSARLGISTENLMVMNGASEAMDKLIMALDGSMLMPSPCFPPYVLQHAYNGKVPRFYDTVFIVRPESYLVKCAGLDIPAIENRITSDTAAILVINPSNPTGVAYGRESLEALVSLARRRGLAIIADEVYNELWLDNVNPRPPLLRELTKDVPIIEIGSFSKTYLMCGYRVGYLAFYNNTPELDALRDAIFGMCIARLSANAPGQLAAIAALKGGTAHVQNLVSTLHERSSVMFADLTAIPGVRVVMPSAGFYSWFSVESNAFSDDKLFARRLADEKAVYILPGSGFMREGIKDSVMWFRAVFLPSLDDIREGMGRMKDFTLSQ